MDVSHPFFLIFSLIHIIKIDLKMIVFVALFVILKSRSYGYAQTWALRRHGASSHTSKSSHVHFLPEKDHILISSCRYQQNLRHPLPATFLISLYLCNKDLVLKQMRDKL